MKTMVNTPPSSQMIFSVFFFSDSKSILHQGALIICDVVNQRINCIFHAIKSPSGNSFTFLVCPSSHA